MQRHRNWMFTTLSPWFLVAFWNTAAPAVIINCSITDLGHFLTATFRYLLRTP